MRVNILHIEVGKVVEASKTLVISTNNPKYSDALKAAGVPFDSKTMALGYADPDRDLWGVNLDDLMEDDETVVVIDKALLKSPSEIAIDKAAAGADHLRI